MMTQKDQPVDNTRETLNTHWLVEDRFHFENVGVSKPIPSGKDDESDDFRYLCCASCDLGPLGIVFTSDFNNFYVSHARIMYK